MKRRIAVWSGLGALALAAVVGGALILSLPRAG